MSERRTMLRGLKTAAAVACLLPLALSARADHKTIQGRAGLPTVRDGKEKIWIGDGTVELKPDGNDLVVTQDYVLQYPGPPTEGRTLRSKIAVREDYYRDRSGDEPAVQEVEAKGFSDFQVTVDGQPALVTTEPWMINDKKDTATRWRVFNVTFKPGDTHKVHIMSRAPLGDEQGRKYVQFIVKDLGHWRQPPDNLVVTYKAPEGQTVDVAALEPKPDGNDPKHIQWVYKKANPGRDILIMLPAAATTGASQ